jgi:hypothetical protein
MADLFRPKAGIAVLGVDIVCFYSDSSRRAGQT